MKRNCLAKCEKRSQRQDDVIAAVIFLLALFAIGSIFAIPMGLGNMLNTMMNTAYQLLVDTSFYIMAIAVLSGALAALLTEFGVVRLLNKLLSPLMRPIFGMPGAAAIGVVTTYLSDNPAIITLAEDPQYRKYFKAYQIPALTNLGTAFGMGLIVTTYMLGLGAAAGVSLSKAVFCGNLGAIAGSVLSTRLMLISSARQIGTEQTVDATVYSCNSFRNEQKESIGVRIIDSILRGGKAGVDLGLGIIPGVLIICTFVMMLTSGPLETGGYTGGAYEGIGLLPLLAEKVNFVFKPLFGFSSSECIAVPVTALGSAGAALGVVNSLFVSGEASQGDVAVFTAMCMCWSGFLSTHVSMMDVLKCRCLSGKSIVWHTFGGIFAGIVAHWLFELVSLI